MRSCTEARTPKSEGHACHRLTDAGRPCAEETGLRERRVKLKNGTPMGLPSQTRGRMTHNLTVEGLLQTAAAIAQAPDAEAALLAVGHAGLSRIGAPCDGARATSETSRRIFHFFLVLPGARQMMLFAEYGWPVEQHRLVTSIDNGRPGWTVRQGRSCVCPNTSEDAVFTQILKTERMGSTIYAPLLWRGKTLGLISFAAQPPYTYQEADLPSVEGLGLMAAAALVAHGGPTLLDVS